MLIVSNPTAEQLSRAVQASPVARDPLKRAMDILVAGGALLFFAPLLALARDGSGVDVARRFAPATPEAGVAATTAPPTAPAPTAALSTAISIAGVALSGGRVTVTDSALAKPVSHVLDGIEGGQLVFRRVREQQRWS